MYRTGRILSVCIIVVMIILLFPGVVFSEMEPVQIYVSANGNDKYGTGTIVHPYKTAKKAQEAARAYIDGGQAGDITVFFRGGRYELSEPLTFSVRDSGRNGYKVIYSGYPNETAQICGSSPVIEWSGCGGNIYSAYVGAGRNINTLYEDEQRSVIARYPNRAANGTDNFNEVYKTAVYKTQDGTTVNKSTLSFVYSIDSTMGKYYLPPITNTSTLQVFMCPGGADGTFCWFSSIIDVQSMEKLTNIKDAATSQAVEYNMVNLKNEPFDNIKVMGAGSRYYIQGALELLDAPGEFYYDKSSGYLYYYPKNTDNLSSGNIKIPMTDNLITVKGYSNKFAENIVFKNLVFKENNADRALLHYTSAAGIALTYANNITIENCKLYNIGGNGVTLSASAQNNFITGNEIYNTGGNGVCLINTTRKAVVSKNTVSNNYIHNNGFAQVGSAGVNLINTSDNIVSHNSIHSTAHAGIDMMGNYLSAMIGTQIDGVTIDINNGLQYNQTQNNIIEYNDISDANLNTQDTGVIYTCGIGGGNLIRYNRIHDSDMHFSFGFGIYLDDQSYDSEIYGNLVYNLQNDNTDGVLYSVVILKGLRNKFYNNITANSNPFKSDFFVDGSTSSDAVNRVGDAYHYLNVQYETGDRTYGTYFSSQTNKIQYGDNNIYYNSRNIYQKYNANTADLQKVNYDVNSVFGTNPLFVNEAEGDYRLRKESPVYNLKDTAVSPGSTVSFEDIDYKSIGTTADFGNNADISLVYPYIESDDKKAFADISAGATLRLNYTVRTQKGLPAADACIEYSTDNPNAATVSDDGIITAVSAGNAKITVTAAKNGVVRTGEFYVYVK